MSNHFLKDASFSICLTWLYYMCDVTHSRLRHDSKKSHICGMTLSCVWPDSFICVTWLIHVSIRHDCKKSQITYSKVFYFPSVRHDSFIRVTWLTHTCDVTHSYVWCDSFICVTWLIHMRDMPHSCVYDSFTCVMWLIHMRDVTHSHVWHDSFTS